MLRYRLARKNLITGFLCNDFFEVKPTKNRFDEESPIRKVEAYDLVMYNSGPLTKLDILDKGC
jgi:hypothetical protein